METIPGFDVTATLGVVTGVSVRARNKYQEGLKALDGTSHPDVVRLMTQARLDAVRTMVAEAVERGANAVVGFRYDHREINAGVSEICAYGTAVRISPVAAP